MSLHFSSGRVLGRVTGRGTAAVRRATARHRWIRWLPIATCATGLVISVAGHTADADAIRAEWGETRTVWVAASAIDAGEPIEAKLVGLPAVAVPDEAAEEVAGRVARQRLVAGEVVTSADVAGPADLALLPAGWRAVAVSESPASGAGVGETVDVASEGLVIAAHAVVLERFDDTTVVGVRAEVAPLVSLANGSGIALLRTGSMGGGDR
jgi:Flp pilus assembly protein CpaB